MNCALRDRGGCQLATCTSRLLHLGRRRPSPPRGTRCAICPSHLVLMGSQHKHSKGTLARCLWDCPALSAMQNGSGEATETSGVRRTGVLSQTRFPSLSKILPPGNPIILMVLSLSPSPQVLLSPSIASTPHTTGTPLGLLVHSNSEFLPSAVRGPSRSPTSFLYGSFFPPYPATPNFSYSWLP